MSETLERAFPVTDRNAGPASGGMTLRDYFAARALQGILSSPDGGPDDWQRVADAAYYAADAMMAARERKEEGR